MKVPFMQPHVCKRCGLEALVKINNRHEWCKDCRASDPVMYENHTGQKVDSRVAGRRLDDEVIRANLRGGMTMTELAERYQVSRGSLYRHLREQAVLGDVRE